jgi:hypothetical protein
MGQVITRFVAVPDFPEGKNFQCNPDGALEDTDSVSSWNSDDPEYQVKSMLESIP